MKQNNYIYYVILGITTLVGMWIVPALVEKMTYKPDSYPFTYYSMMLEDMGIITYSNKETPMEDTKGNKYTTAEFDSLMPMLNSRQLMSDGRMPDSIRGIAMEMRNIRSKSIVYRLNPKEIVTPSTNLHMLFESMPIRVGLTVPDDVFRIKDKIEFVDAETNTINEVKSDLFQKAFEKEGYTFPTQWAAGNPNPRKPYDEGYFCLDAKGELYHLKMVNGRPYFKNTKVSERINVAWFSMLEVSDKRFYGILYSKEGEMYIVENEGGGYKTLNLDLKDPTDIKEDQVILMGDIFNWTVSIISPTGKRSYALDTQTLARVSEVSFERETSTWEKVTEWLFPAYITLENKNSDYLSPSIHFTSAKACIVNLVLALLVVVLVRNTKEKRIFNGVFVLLTGIIGLIALFMLPNFRKRF